MSRIGKFLDFIKDIVLLHTLWNKDMILILFVLIILISFIKCDCFDLSKLFKCFKSNKRNKDNKVNIINQTPSESSLSTDEDPSLLNVNNDVEPLLKSSSLPQSTPTENNIDEISLPSTNSDSLNENKNIKLVVTPKKEPESTSKDPYMSSKPLLQKDYKNDFDKHEFIINVNSTTCSTPIFNLRTHEGLDFHYNFLIHNFNPQKINNLIMCKDIHQWMTTSSLSNEDLPDGYVPIYFIKKMGDSTDVYDYLKLFINTDENGIKIAFVQKGMDYLFIENDINQLISMGLIKDLLSGKHYYNYNLSTHDGVSEFLTNFLSLVLISEDLIGSQVELDIKNYCENKNTYEYFFNTVNSEANMFNTSI
jgi:hypothetical protein